MKLAAVLTLLAIGAQAASIRPSTIDVLVERTASQQRDDEASLLPARDVHVEAREGGSGGHQHAGLFNKARRGDDVLANNIPARSSNADSTLEHGRRDNEAPHSDSEGGASGPAGRRDVETRQRQGSGGDRKSSGNRNGQTAARDTGSTRLGDLEARQKKGGKSVTKAPRADDQSADLDNEGPEPRDMEARQASKNQASKKGANGQTRGRRADNLGDDGPEPRDLVEARQSATKGPNGGGKNRGSRGQRASSEPETANGRPNKGPRATSNTEDDWE